jgi:hypothetical protein
VLFYAVERVEGWGFAIVTSCHRKWGWWVQRQHPGPGLSQIRGKPPTLQASAYLPLNLTFNCACPKALPPLGPLPVPWSLLL